MDSTTKFGSTRSLDPLLRARAVAVIGASGRAGTFGHALLRQLIDRGYTGAVYPVNPTRAEIDGVECFPDVQAIPERVDLAVLAVADDRLEEALGAVAAARIPAAVIFGAGAATEVTPESLPERLRAIARDAGIVVCGGNCMGFYNYQDRLLVSGYPPQGEWHAGPIGVVTHSGSSFSALANTGRGLRFNYLISSGQELVTTSADYLRFLVEQPETRVIGCFLETVRDAEGFVVALELAARRDIPVVVLKVGRSERAARLAMAHSGAFTGDDAVYDALFARYGVIRVQSLDELVDTLELLAPPRRPRAAGLALGSDSGGERALIADVAASLDLSFADLAPHTTRRLTASLEPGLMPGNPLDLWGTGDDYARRYEESLLALAADPAVGLLVFAVDLVPGSRLLSSYLDIAERVHQQTEKPFAVMGNLASTIEREAAARLRASGIPVLMGTATGLAAVRHVLTREQWTPPPNVDSLVPPEVLVRWRSRLEAADGSPLAMVAAGTLLADFGIPCVWSEEVTSAAAAVAATRRVGLPIVMKTAAPEVLHKSDVGGVIMGLTSAAAVRRAYARLNTAFGRRVIVQPMLPTSTATEMFLGMTRDSQFGPLMTVGLGGLWIEALRDTVMVWPPVTETGATRIVRCLRGHSVLTGARGRPPADLDRLAQVISCFSHLCRDLGAWLDAIDINPMLVGPDGLIAVDAVVIPRVLGKPEPARQAG